MKKEIKLFFFGKLKPGFHILQVARHIDNILPDLCGIGPIDYICDRCFSFNHTYRATGFFFVVSFEFEPIAVPDISRIDL